MVRKKGFYNVHNNSVLVSYVHVDQYNTRTKDSKACNGSLLTLFQVVLSLPIAFSVSLEGSDIKMKLFAPIPEDNMLKA